MEGSSNYGFLLSLISLHLVVASLIISSGSAARVVVHTRGRSTPTTTTTTTEFIRTSCGATTYPRVCVASLSAYATTIQTSPREMAHAALSVTLAGARTASAAIAKMSTLPAGPKKIITKPREKAAVRDCLEELSDSVDELRRSMGEMGRLSGGGRPGFEAKMNDIQTWVSAALTDEDTCMDGFEGVSSGSEVRRAVRGRVVNLAQLTSNALALINALAATAAP